ncbi:bifunctional molybdenum cofactor biosynthesis protein MoaC/MoaB [Jonesiaceae bacterium BS-20]|uniref:Cyclic pyranopterin monophosphate synthase n=1 Tax=Jonesiaceae bacterium BS-20 TaxID=3120821 RepID=A0AAU7DZT2_9MICO
MSQEPILPSNGAEGKSDRLTHVDSSGKVHMVDVGDKPVTKRRSVARGHVALEPHTITLLREGELKKGDALAVARIAGTAAAKKTPDLIPLCHPVAITSVSVTVDLVADGVAIEASVRTADRTGIEMEALTCVAAAALNVIDMVKAVDRAAHITKIWVEKKEGGASGSWERGQAVELVTGAQHATGAGSAIGAEQVTGAEPQSRAEVVSSTVATPPSPHASVPAPTLDAGAAHGARKATGTVGVITISDRAARGERVDETGPMICQTVTDWGATPTHLTVPDDAADITNATRTLIEGGAWLIVTTGGTGITVRDVTPQTLSRIFDFEIPGIAEALRQAGVGKAPGALLSRSVAGVIGNTAVVTLPGSVGGVRDGLDVIGGVIGHLSHQLANGDH